jgi:TetR/AcrR family transcriptional repressor of nem operon
MPRPRRSDDTRQRLLEEGVEAFVQHGYHGTGLKEVLDRVQVPKGSFYNYFPSKEAFGVEVIRHYAAGFERKLSEALEGAPDPLTGLRRFFKRLMKEFEAAQFTGGCLVGNLGGELEGSEVCREALQAAWRAWSRSVRDAIAAAQEKGLVRRDIDAAELADLLVDSWEGAVIRMKLERSLKPLRDGLRRLLDGYFAP